MYVVCYFCIEFYFFIIFYLVFRSEKKSFFFFKCELFLRIWFDRLFKEIENI